LIGQVSEIKDFGLIVKLNRAQEGVLHVKELTHDSTLLLKKNLQDIVEIGQNIEVKVYFILLLFYFYYFFYYVHYDQELKIN
jgi:predicted RNA-binding protein with RPS1 domain